MRSHGNGQDEADERERRCDRQERLRRLVRPGPHPVRATHKLGFQYPLARCAPDLPWSLFLDIDKLVDESDNQENDRNVEQHARFKARR
jgi:hypothetical protein